MSVFVITGPSGVGKSHLIHELRRYGIDSINVYTDRARRPSEEDTTDRVYLTKEQFDKNLDAFMYWFEFQGNRYGYKKGDIDLYTKGGRSVCLSVTPTHLKFLLERLPEAIVIYLHTPKDDFHLLFKRMVERDICEEDDDKVREVKIRAIEARLNFALEELDLRIDIGTNPRSRRFLIKDDKALYDEVVPYVVGLVIRQQLNEYINLLRLPSFNALIFPYGK